MEIFLWLIGIVVAIAIAHIYYRLSVNKRLSFFLLVDEQPFSRMDPNVRSRLRILFEVPAPPGQAGDMANADQDLAVASVQHLQVVIANTGARAITFNAAPTIDIPAQKSILDASIIHQHPSDLDATLARLPVEAGQPQKVVCSVKMMNPREYVVVKFLLSDVAAASELCVHVLAEDLPRTIRIESLPPEATKSRLESIEWAAVFAGIVLLAFTACVLHLIILAFGAHNLPLTATDGFFDFFGSLKLIHYELTAAGIGSLALVYFSLALIFGIGLMPSTKSKRVILPTELRPASLPSVLESKAPSAVDASSTSP